MHDEIAQVGKPSDMMDESGSQYMDSRWHCGQKSSAYWYYTTASFSWKGKFSYTPKGLLTRRIVQFKLFDEKNHQSDAQNKISSCWIKAMTTSGGKYLCTENRQKY